MLSYLSKAAESAAELENVRFSLFPQLRNLNCLTWTRNVWLL